MKKKILSSLVVMFLFSSTAILADTTTDKPTDTQQPSTFEKGMIPPPDINKNGSNTNKFNPPKGNPPPQFKDQNNSTNKQFGGKIPSKKPDKKPNGEKTPPEWQSSNTSSN